MRCQASTASLRATAARADALMESTQRSRRAHRGVSGFDQEPAGMALALTADVAGAGCPIAGLTNTWVQAQVADELVGAGEAADITDHTHDGQCGDQPDAGDGHQTW